MEDVQIIEKAIRENRFIEFIYHDTRRIVAPYRVEQLPNGGLVLRAMSEQTHTMRTYKLTEISQPDVLNRTFDMSFFESAIKTKAAPESTVQKLRGIVTGILKRNK